ncbi:universal stress protein [Streptomyces bobili]|uniref:universal stress protein n=1 Tax=Streptomyces bobili TaxID=67280 RepID=UPI000A3ABD49|nr:universal stress protein [Streptomyces bobili]
MTGSHGTVLVGVDDTPHSWLAAEWAATEAELRGGALRIVHALGPGPEVGYDETGAGLTREVFEAATGQVDAGRARIAAAHPGLRVDAVLAHDRPAEAILDSAGDADLIVVGTRGRGGFAGLLLGSVSLKVAAHADRPVAVVRERPEAAKDAGVVVGVRDDRDEEAVRFAVVEAARRRTPLRVVHAWTPVVWAGELAPPPELREEEQHRHRVLLSRAARPAAEYPHVRIETDLVADAPAAALVEASQRAGLVVLPRHPAEGRLGLRLGSVTHAVLHHARCPVAVVPTR